MKNEDESDEKLEQMGVRSLNRGEVCLASSNRAYLFPRIIILAGKSMVDRETPVVLGFRDS